MVWDFFFVHFFVEKIGHDDFFDGVLLFIGAFEVQGREAPDVDHSFVVDGDDSVSFVVEFDDGDFAVVVEFLFVVVLLVDPDADVAALQPVRQRHFCRMPRHCAHHAFSHDVVVLDVDPFVLEKGYFLPRRPHRQNRNVGVRPFRRSYFFVWYVDVVAQE